MRERGEGEGGNCLLFVQILFLYLFLFVIPSHNDANSVFLVKTDKSRFAFHPFRPISKHQVSAREFLEEPNKILGQ